MNYQMQGSQSFVPISEKVVYIRHSHISDAVAVYDVLASAPELGQVSYYGVKALAEVSFFPFHSRPSNIDTTAGFPTFHRKSHRL